MLIYSDLLGRIQGLVHGFTTRHGGVSAGPFATFNLSYRVGDDPRSVERNLALLAEGAGFALENLITLSQVHSRRVVVVGSEAGCLGEGDALIATKPGPVVAVRTADCVPVLIALPGRAVAAVHAGWRGAVAGVVQAAVEQLAALTGSPPRHMVAAIGPAIGPCCFNVGPEVHQAFQGLEGAALEGQPLRVDLPHAVRASLLNTGILSEAIDLIRLCTSCNPHFFSHRRDQGQSGRQMAFIGLKEGV